MYMDVQHPTQVTSKLASHFVWCLKYRKSFWWASLRQVWNKKYATSAKRTPGREGQ
jgi:REP element-mobilizing transposase RayT